MPQYKYKYKVVTAIYRFTDISNYYLHLFVIENFWLRYLPQRRRSEISGTLLTPA
jgi:hypothetical protein